MMADEPLETMEEEDEDEDYESEEDTPVIDQDFMNDGRALAKFAIHSINLN